MSRIIIFVILNKNKYQIDAHNICHRHSHSYLYFGCVIVLSFRLGFFDVQTFMSLFGLGFVVMQLVNARLLVHSSSVSCWYLLGF